MNLLCALLAAVCLASKTGTCLVQLRASKSRVSADTATADPAHDPADPYERLEEAVMALEGALPRAEEEADRLTAMAAGIPAEEGRRDREIESVATVMEELSKLEASTTTTAKPKELEILGLSVPTLIVLIVLILLILIMACILCCLWRSPEIAAPRKDDEWSKNVQAEAKQSMLFVK
mmetsp:Transcript_6616/g.15837  ORF Transcript_6616/g.15837 Transcript_6616/m.15837 type:complete len:178 (+) Transcript_6616:48-581(+)